MKPTTFSAALFALASVGAAQAQQDAITTAASTTDWTGFYLGANIGGAWNNTCNTWEPGHVITSGSYPGLATKFYDRDCPNDGKFIGGLDLGYNFQYNQWVWGLKADYDFVEGSSSHSRSYTFTTAPGYPIPSGTFTGSSKINPDGIILLGPRIGYAFDNWLPFFRVGGAFAVGSHEASLNYTPTISSGPSVNPLIATVPATTLTAGKDFDSSGWNVGAGLDYKFGGGPWSFALEYNYVNLGHGSSDNFSCSTEKGKVPPICTTYANLSLDNIHNSFTMNMFRVGFHYSFGRRAETPPAESPPPAEAAAAPAAPAAPAVDV